MPRRQSQPPNSSGEEFDSPSTGSSSSDSDSDTDLLSLSGGVQFTTVNANATKEDYDLVRA